MRKEVTFICLVFLIILSSSIFVSASWWDKITGNVVSESCTDSDGGKDFYIKGICSGEDYPEGIEDRCDNTPGSEDFVEDFYCYTEQEGINEGKTHCVGHSYECPYGCSDGRCLPNCEESDNGKDYFIKGKIITEDLIGSGDGSGGEDYCVKEDGSTISSEGKYLVEYFCCDGYCADNERIECPNGCVDGACIDVPNETKTCKKVFGSSDPSKTMNLFIVPINYPSDKLYYNGTYNLKDFSINFENDVYRMLFGESENLGYGLLNVEPFYSNLDKITVFILPQEFYFGCIDGSHQNYISFFTDKLKECEHFDDKDYIFALIGEKQSVDNQCLECGGGPGISCAGREFIIGYENTITTFRHELGHQYGLRDLYGPPFYESSIQDFLIHNEWALKWGYNDQIYGDFWTYYYDWVIGDYNGGRENPDEPGVIMKSNEQPNCDYNAGCPKWCNGYPLEKFIDSNPCQNYSTEEECVNHGPGIVGGQDCLWFPNEHPYFGVNCISLSGGNQVDIGVDCINGAGCYFGCQGHGFRAHPYGDLAAQRVDENGIKHGYDAASELFLSEVFNCCFPQDCDSFNYELCNNFVNNYKFKTLNYKDRFSDCNVCDGINKNDDANISIEKNISKTEEEKDKCPQLGFREGTKYCSLGDQWIEQKGSESICENNFECNSNLCIDGKCISSNLWQKFIRWLSRLFG